MLKDPWVWAGGSLPPAVLVALGAIPGAWMRYLLVRLGSTRLRQRHWATWGVNMVACGLMGLLAGLQEHRQQPWQKSSQDTLELALAVGFLGSLSTYSSLMAELVSLWQGKRQGHALRLAAASLFGGLAACLVGLQLARSRG
jgi:CrcB protein